MLRNLSRLECKVNERPYDFNCNNDSPLEDVKEALCQFLKYVGNIEDQVKEARAKVEAEKIEKDEKVVEETKTEKE